jgi:hypothetical protein
VGGSLFLELGYFLNKAPG